MSRMRCCFLDAHPDAAAIDAALLAGNDPREVARRFNVGKSATYQHRHHVQQAEKARAPQVVDSTPIPPPPVHSTERSEQPAAAEENAPRARPQVAETKNGTHSVERVGEGYAKAVEASITLISQAQWRASHVQGLSERFGITVPRARAAYQEATRHLRIDMGGHLERLEVSIAWVSRQRDDARGRGDARDRLAEEWRRRERAFADKDDTENAARAGMVAAKYGLEAEKWHAQALAHQRHLDDIQCLRGPRELHMTQNNMMANMESGALGRFAAALAARFKDRPDVLEAIDAAAAELEVVQEQREVVVMTQGEAA